MNDDSQQWGIMKNTLLNVDAERIKPKWPCQPTLKGLKIGRDIMYYQYFSFCVLKCVIVFNSLRGGKLSVSSPLRALEGGCMGPEAGHEVCHGINECLV